MMPPNFPDIKSYLHIQFYLKDIYDYRKRKDADFSYTVWSQEIGVKNRSYLRLIISGRRSLSEEIASLIKNHLRLNEGDDEYFTYLVLYSQCKDAGQKKIYGRKLVQNIRKNDRPTEIHSFFDFVTEPALPRLRTLLSYEKFEGSIQAVCDTLELSEKDAQKSVQKLEGLGLAIQDEGRWRATAGSMAVNDHPGDIALELFHSHSLRTAIDAQKLPPAERRYRSLMLAMSESEYEKILENFQIFIEEQLSLHDNKTVNGRRLYQMNFNLIPISKKIQDN